MGAGRVLTGERERGREGGRGGGGGREGEGNEEEEGEGRRRGRGGGRRTENHKKKQGPCGLSCTWEPRPSLLMTSQLPVLEPAFQMSIMFQFRKVLKPSCARADPQPSRLHNMSLSALSAWMVTPSMRSKNHSPTHWVSPSHIQYRETLHCHQFTRNRFLWRLPPGCLSCT